MSGANVTDTESACQPLHLRQHPPAQPPPSAPGGLARQLGQHALGVQGVVGLAINGASEATVVSENTRWGQLGSPAARTATAGVELQAR